MPKQETPSRRSCASVQAYFGLLDKYPQYRLNQASIESFTRTLMRAGAAAFRAGIIKIPVVVHVVYRTNVEKISDAQVRSQILVLNRDFRAKNKDIAKVPQPFKTLVGDARIAFALARTDPDGNPTKGITRTKTDQTFITVDDDVKSPDTGGVAPWDTSRYLNIWVCTLKGTLLGYAQFPGGPPETDGAVIRNTAFGTTGSAEAPFHKGRTTTHEIGHYLNLSHIWGESRFPSCSDSDFVDDTPNQFGPNGGEPDFPHVSCDNGPNGDMFMNYMDYVDDAAMFMFTKGQVARMQAALAGPRAGLGA
jgi:hypothetical protein